MQRLYEVNANGNRGYSSQSADRVADVAAAWRMRGLEPHAYVITEENDMPTIRRVKVTTRRETAKALANA